MRRRAQRVLGAVVIALAMTAGLAACSGGVIPGSDSASDLTEPPELGTCRDLEAAAISHATNDTEVIPCSEEHTSETFLIGELPASSGTSYKDRAHSKYVLGVCTKAFERFLGADESLVLRSQLSWAWFRASEKGWDKGARWFRCDAVGGPADAKELRALPTTVKGLMKASEVSEWMTCAQGEVFAGSVKVACSREHDWRAVTAVKIGTPQEAWPGDRVSEVRARDNCSDWVGAWMNYPTDYEYGYSIFHEAEWNTGNRRALCWARTDK